MLRFSAVPYQQAIGPKQLTIVLASNSAVAVVQWLSSATVYRSQTSPTCIDEAMDLPADRSGRLVINLSQIRDHMVLI
jgi:uncharacterized membrane protein